MRPLSILDPSDGYRFLSDGVYIVRRAPKRFLGQLSSLIHRCPMHWAHLMEGKAKRKCSCLLVVRRLDVFPSLPGIVTHRKKERRAPARPVGPLT